MRYRHFVDFRHGISVLANFAYGIAVLGTPPPHPQCPPHFVWKRFSWITQQICLPGGFQQKQVQDNKLDWKNSLEHKLTLFTNVGENCVLITYNGNISFNFIDIAAWVIVTFVLQRT